MSTQHTPTPLAVGKPSADLPNFVCIRGPEDTGAWSVAWTADTDTAAFIVRACNSHDALVAALRTAHYYLHDAKNLPARPGAGLAETLRAVDTALAAAEGNKD